MKHDENEPMFFDIVNLEIPARFVENTDWIKNDSGLFCQMAHKSCLWVLSPAYSLFWKGMCAKCEENDNVVYKLEWNLRPTVKRSTQTFWTLQLSYSSVQLTNLPYLRNPKFRSYRPETPGCFHLEISKLLLIKIS